MGYVHAFARIKSSTEPPTSANLSVRGQVDVKAKEVGR
jgi:hypothetical protein